jgi:DNA-binding MarR family transcriptional regulator
MPRRQASHSQAEEILASLRRIVAHVTDASSSDWMAVNVTMPQLKVLLLLQEHGAMRVGVLARHLVVSTPTITGIVDRLVREGLVERADDPTDRRVVLNVLTAKGKTLVEQLQHRSEAEMQRLAGTLSTDERTEAAEVLRRLAEAFAAAS